jgi:hypothetical protein
MNTHRHTQALREIQAQLKSPIVAQVAMAEIEKIVDDALRVDDKAGDADIPLAQLTLDGNEERVANAAEIARSVVRDLAPYNLPRAEFLRRAQWLAWLRYPGDRENCVRIVRAMEVAMTDVEAVMQLNITADFPSLDTLTRALRKVAPASIDDLRNSGGKTECKS